MAERVRRARVVEEEPQESTPVRKTGRMAGELSEPEFDYESDLYIDPNFLDAEFLKHTSTFMRYAAESSRAKKAAAFAEEKVKTLRSQLVKQANDDPDVCLGKGVKPTAPNVEAFYRTNAGYIEVKSAWVEAVYYADLMSNAVFAFQSRKCALENLVRLHGQQYFSTPQEPRDLPEAAKRLTELKQQSTENIIKERMKRG